MAWCWDWAEWVLRGSASPDVNPEDTCEVGHITEERLVIQTANYTAASLITLLHYLKTKLKCIQSFSCVHGCMCGIRQDMCRLDWIFFYVCFNIKATVTVVTVNPEKTYRGTWRRVVDLQWILQYVRIYTVDDTSVSCLWWKELSLKGKTCTQPSWIKAILTSSLFPQV